MERTMIRYIGQLRARGISTAKIRAILTDPEENTHRLSRRLKVPLFVVSTLRRLAYQSPLTLRLALHQVYLAAVGAPKPAALPAHEPDPPAKAPYT